MLFSEERKFVYIAVPKTGTTSVEEEMRRIDPTILRNHLVLPSGEIRRVNKHVSLRAVQALLGEKASEYKYFGFVREPVDHTISRYFYYATGRGYQRFREGEIGKRSLAYKVRFTRAIPRRLWFLVYPLRQQISYLRDEGGRVAVDFCGRVDRLETDLTAMLRVAGYDGSHQIGHLNIAPRAEIGAAERRFIAAVLKWRLRGDIAFFRGLPEGCGVS